jgi:hypothetical protein
MPTLLGGRDWWQRKIRAKEKMNTESTRKFTTQFPRLLRNFFQPMFILLS